MIVYTKTISAMQAYKELDGQQNLVFSIMWNLVGEEGGFTTSCPAITYVPYIPGQPVIPFSELTESQVLSWIDTYTTLAQMQQYENTVAFSLLQQRQQETPALPWGQPASS